MDLRFSPQWQRTGTHTRSVSSSTVTLAAATVVHSVILAGSDPCPLSHYCCLTETFALLEIHTLSCLVGKNIRRVILFEWVMLFKKQTVNVLIGNYIHRVNVIKGSLYSQVYSMSCWGEKRYQAIPFCCFLYCKWQKGGSGLGKRQCMSLFPSHSVQYNLMEVKCCTCIVIYYV